MPDALDRIPISTANRWRIFCHDFLPAVSFFMLLGILGWIWKYQVGLSHVLGEVETIRIAISSPANGVLQELPGVDNNYWKMFDQVSIDDIVVRIEPFVMGGTVAPTATEDPEAVKAYSPINGTIVEIHRRPGQFVRRGDPILTIVANKGHFILSHVPESQIQILHRGDKVSMRIPGSVSTFEGTIDRIGPIVVRMPARQVPTPDVDLYGLPIHITLPENYNLRPGTLVEIQF